MDADSTTPHALRCTGVAPGGPDRPTPFGLAVLVHHERHVRRAVIALVHGDRVALDLPEPVTLRHGDRLVLADGREAEVIAGEEALIEVTGRDAKHLAEIAWHLGNRHTPAQIEAGRILVAREPVLMRMLEGLGAKIRRVDEPFSPEHGAYHGHAHGSDSHEH